MEIFVKDMELGRFILKFPEFAAKVERMRSLLPGLHKNHLVDLVVMDCEPGKVTCRDVRWHVDGDPRRDNLYVLNVEGPNRTEFLAEPVDLPTLPECREDQNRLLESLLRGRLSLRIPEGEDRLYDSRTPHRGVLCDEHGRRTFLRLMATDYIKPKNIIRRGQDVPFRSAV
jgi:hypothetical protein